MTIELSPHLSIIGPSICCSDNVYSLPLPCCPWYICNYAIDATSCIGSPLSMSSNQVVYLFYFWTGLLLEWYLAIPVRFTAKFKIFLDRFEGSGSNLETYTNGRDKHRLNEVLWKGTWRCGSEFIGRKYNGDDRWTVFLSTRETSMPLLVGPAFQTPRRLPMKTVVAFNSFRRVHCTSKNIQIKECFLRYDTSGFLWRFPRVQNSMRTQKFWT